jgi:WD40 repeat protein
MKVLAEVAYELPVSKVRIHPNRQMFASLAADSQEAVLWRWSRSGQVNEVLSIGAGANEPRFLDVAFHPTANLFAVVGIDQLIRVVNLDSGAVDMELGALDGKTNHQGYTSTVFCSSGRRLVASVYPHRRNEVYDLKSGEMESEYCGSGFDAALALHPENEIIANAMTQDAGSSVRFVTAADKVKDYGRELPTLMAIGGLTFSPDGGMLALVGGIPPLELQIHDFPSCRKRFEVVADPPKPLVKPWIFTGGSPFTERVAFAADSKSIVCPWPTGKLRVLNADTGELLETYHAHDGVATSVVPDYKRDLLISGGLDGRIILWRTRGGAMPAQ